MSKILILIYGVVSYAVGMAGLTFFILFVGGWEFMPLHVNSGMAGSFRPAIAINLGLMLLWGVQHSVMARPTFKKTWTSIIPATMERSTYVLLSGIIITIMCLNWQSIEGMVWDIENSAARIVLNTLHIGGWVIVVIATFLINHFEFFGLQQVWFNLKNRPEPEPNYSEKFLYKIVRHPLEMGFLMGLWFTPTMSMTLFYLSAMMTIYIFIGLHYKERNLTESLGESYADYKTRVRKIIPIPK